MEIRHQSNYSAHIFCSSQAVFTLLPLNAALCLCRFVIGCFFSGLQSCRAVFCLCLQASVYKICKEMYCEGMEDGPFPEDDPDLIGDR